ncbi:HIRAN domain-containing protein [Janibacter massiliensis]|uniref:HIRAN domain-containing protein n=1 Tax=Janibacter massiliensis TaxID=2058291 RepID=UPI000D0F6E73|nr:HIRAN domain-containing protein [Janibacter massiliensis]
MGWFTSLFKRSAQPAHHPAAHARASGAVPHVPAPPQLGRYVSWGPTPITQEVAGENWYDDAFRRLLHGHPAFATLQGQEIRDDAVLAPDPGNPYDANAISVRVRGEHVGYLPRDDAARWNGALTHLASRGYALHAPARVWARADDRRVYARVTVQLPADPSHLYAANPFPQQPWRALEPGNRCQATKEEPHQERLLGLYRQHGPDATYAAVLTLTERATKTQVKQVLEVTIDGNPVGELTPTTTAKYLASAQQAASRGELLVARASIYEGKNKLEVRLDARQYAAEEDQ